MTGQQTPPLTPQAVQAKFLEGWALHQQGQFGPAWGIYQQVIAAAPQHFDALHLTGIIAAQARFYDQAVELIGRAVQVQPGNAAAHYNLGNTFGELKRYHEAVASYDRAIALDPAYADPYNNRGNALWSLKQYKAAIESFDKAIALKPDYAEAYTNRGNALRDDKALEAALASFDKAIALRPAFPEAYNNRGNALRDLKRYDEAVADYDKAISLRPDYAEAYNNRGNALQSLKRQDEAAASYDRAIQLKPDYADAYYNRAVSLRFLKQPAAALENYNQAAELSPDRAEAFHGRGLARADLKDYIGAIADYDRAIELKPDYAEAYNNRGAALGDLHRHAEAIASYDSAIAIKADYPEAYNNKGVALKELKQDEAALASYDKAVELNPDSAEAYNNRGILLGDMRRNAEAVASYARALEINPSYAFLFGSLLHTKMHICDWRGVEADVATLKAKIARGEQAASPFHVLALIDDTDTQVKSAQIWTQKERPRNPALGPVPRPPRHQKIRVGYFSMDFRNHPTSLLLAGVIDAHDQDKFDTYAFSYGIDTQDRMRKRMEAGFGKFFDVRGVSDIEAVSLARECELDIAIDLAGYTNDSRTGIFALGAAPIQVNYLGYPGSMGADYYDYIIADSVVVPDDQRQFYAEKVVQMPYSYQSNDMTRHVGERVITRAELGLPADSFVFCCFNNNFKVTPDVFGVWMRILKQVPKSVLWLFEDNAAAADNLRREAEHHGIDAGRLVFAGRVTHGDHLARHRAADLFLDTAPYNAHTTASDALWVGLPLLTCPGRSFPARVAASILGALQMPELIADSWADYEAKAVILAQNPLMLADIRQKIARNRVAAPLFNARLFARHVEDAYRQMFERHHAGLPPDHIKVAP